MLMVIIPLDHYASFLKTLLPLSLVFKMVFITSIFYTFVADFSSCLPFDFFMYISFGSFNKDFWLKWPICACNISIVRVETRLTIVSFAFSANQIIYWF